MKFLTVLIIVFLYRNWIGGHPVRGRIPVQDYFHWFKQKDIAVNLRYFLAVGLPVILAFAISLKVGGWIFGLVWFAFALAVMLYAVDIYDEDEIFEDQAKWLNEPEANIDLETMQRRQDDFLMVTNYEIFQSVYPALFWFLILGPGGALAYVLSKQYLDGLSDDDDEMDLVERIVYFMEWPAARISGLLYALLGHFGRSFEVWLSSLGDTNESIGVVLGYMASAAIDTPTTEESGTVEAFARASESTNEQLHSLMDRTLFGWLGVATIIAIIGL